MIKNNFISLFVLIAVLLLASACSKDFLNVDPKATQLESNYYQNADELYNGLVAAYDPMGWEGGKEDRYANFLCLVAASDEALGGGGSSADVPYFNTMDDYAIDAANGPQLGFWEKDFAGVSRVNTLLSKLKNDISGLDDATRQRYVAEALFLRAYYYFELVRLFGNVPLFTAPLPTDEIYAVKQVPAEEVYAQIEKDLKAAVEEPNLPDQVPIATEGGRITKGAAHALLGKVYLFEEKWDAAAKELALVNGDPGGNNTYGYHLLPNYADIFKPDNPFNAESILEIPHTAIAASGWGNTSLVEGLIASKMCGPRSYAGPLYYSGWGGCPVSTKLYNALHNDPRFQATIIDADSLQKAGAADYIPGYENTGYFVRKFAPLTAFQNAGAGTPALNYPQNYIQIRLADTYLMEAEALVQGGGDLSRAAALLNAVRSRVSLAPVAVTLKNIYEERFLELATEGHRWYTLVRTGQAQSVLGPLGFSAGKNEVLPIPLQELNNTALKQNPGY